MGVDILNRLENHRVLSASGTYTADFNSDVFVSGTLYAANISSGGVPGSVDISSLVPYSGAISGLYMRGYPVVGSVQGTISGTGVSHITGSIVGTFSGAGISTIGSIQGTTGSYTGSFYAGRFIGEFGGVYDKIVTFGGAVVVSSGNVVTSS